MLPLFGLERFVKCRKQMGRTVMEVEQLLTEEEKRTLTVGGYNFKTAEDAGLAKLEQQKIDYIEKRLNYDRPEDVLAVYEKAVENRTFQTPVGIKYLEKLHRYLEENETVNAQISPISLNTNFSRKVREQASPARNRISPNVKKDKLKSRFRISIFFNIVLLLMVAAMFYITLESDNPNVLNYEKALTNKYASWEQELKEREKQIRELERKYETEHQKENIVETD